MLVTVCSSCANALRISLLNWRNLSLVVANLTAVTLFSVLAAASGYCSVGAVDLGNSFRSMFIPTLISSGSHAPSADEAVPPALVAST